MDDFPEHPILTLLELVLVGCALVLFPIITVLVVMGLVIEESIWIKTYIPSIDEVLKKKNNCATNNSKEEAVDKTT